MQGKGPCFGAMLSFLEYCRIVVDAISAVQGATKNPCKRRLVYWALVDYVLVFAYKACAFA